jgi:RNA polymerase sigma factor (sigma-70 family)
MSLLVLRAVTLVIAVHMKFFNHLSRAHRFEKQIRPHLNSLHRYASRLTGHADDAEDLVQELLLGLYRKEIQLDKLDNPATWLLKSLYHQFVDFTRRQQRNPGLPNPASFDELLNALPDEHSRAEQLAEHAMLHQQLQRALAILNPEQRALVVLHDMEGFVLSELELILDTPLGTLKSRLHRARQILRDRIFLEPFVDSERDTG